MAPAPMQRVHAEIIIDVKNVPEKKNKKTLENVKKRDKNI